MHATCDGDCFCGDGDDTLTPLPVSTAVTIAEVIFDDDEDDDCLLREKPSPVSVSERGIHVKELLLLLLDFPLRLDDFCFCDDAFGLSLSPSAGEEEVDNGLLLMLFMLLELVFDNCFEDEEEEDGFENNDRRNETRDCDTFVVSSSVFVVVVVVVCIDGDDVVVVGVIARGVADVEDGEETAGERMPLCVL